MLMVGWAIEERLIIREDNPASRMERNLPKKRKGDRVLSLEEARAVWRAADSGFAFDNHVRLMLLTACRAGEWARARWSWVDLKQGLLVIPADEYKTNRPHVVPLVPEAVAILENSFWGGKGDFVLSTTEGEKPIRGLAKFYQTRLPQAILNQTGAVISPFTSGAQPTRLEYLPVASRAIIASCHQSSPGNVPGVQCRRSTLGRQDAD